MQVKARRFPYPVLSYFADDLVNCAFQAGLQINTTRTTYGFTVRCKTSSKDLDRLIKDKKAYYAIHIECGSTRFRRVETSFAESFTFEVPADRLDGKVQICSFILAAEDIENYTNSNFHNDYEGIGFAIKKADILAVDRDKFFDADKEVDPLKKIPSIFTVVGDVSSDAPPFDIDASGNKVVLRLSATNYQLYKSLKTNQNMQMVLASLLIVPALVSLLEMIKRDVVHGAVDDYEERRWFRTLATKLKAMNIDIASSNSFLDSTIVIAQKLIGNPISGALKAIEEVEAESEG